MTAIEIGAAQTSKTRNEGLCSDCTHARRIESDRGSVFIMCQFSSVDPTFPKYPRLPVLSCSAYTPGEQSPPAVEPR